jgi:dTDP-4-dehydrorhamnose 3,5-epimerase
MTVKYNESFDYFEDDNMSRVFEIFPDCYGDSRGYFMEVLKYAKYSNENPPGILINPDWISQINRSSSSSGVFRGFHAQFGSCCQGKLVEAVTEMVYDIIVDARPNSKTFGSTSIIPLYSETHNKLWVPRGFLHSFLVPNTVLSNAIFEYICDNLYVNESEITINPQTILPNIIPNFEKLLSEIDDPKYVKKFDDMFSTIVDGNLKFSEKDLNGTNFYDFMSQVKDDYDNHNRLWCK